MSEIPWTIRAGENRKRCFVDIPAIAENIAEAVNVLAERWDEKTGEKRGHDPIGTSAAFDPNDPETNPLFGAVWQYAFPDPPYAPSVQEAILKRLESFHPETIPLMRDIGYYSEWEMEKGFCKNALGRTSEVTPINGRIFKLSKFARMAVSDGPEDAHIFLSNPIVAVDSDKELTVQQGIDKRRELLDTLIHDFPYPTYDAMHYHEVLMVTMLEKKGYFSSVCNQPYLIIEAGALPLDAVYASISRLDGEVVITNKDPESHRLASEFIAELERLNILVGEAEHIKSGCN